MRVSAILNKRNLGIALCAYGLLWLGGTWSFQHTHRCVRSHPVYTEDDRAYEECDYYRENGNRWNLLSPITASPLWFWR